MGTATLKNLQDEDNKTSFNRGSLKTKLSNYERWKIGKLYQENEGLVKYFGKQLIASFPSVPPVEIYSCINIAFVKAARSWDSNKGKFSTVLGYFCKGEVRHYMRTSAYWGYRAEHKLRELGMKARALMGKRNVPTSILPGLLGCTKEELRMALESTLQVMYRASQDDRPQGLLEEDDHIEQEGEEQWH